MSFLQRTSLSAALYREKLMRVLENNLDSTHLAVVSAMILGDKQLISKNIKGRLLHNRCKSCLSFVRFTSYYFV